MIQEFKKIWKPSVIGLLWFFALLWPMTGINRDGTLSFAKPFQIWISVVIAAIVILTVYAANKGGVLLPVTRPAGVLTGKLKEKAKTFPTRMWLAIALAAALLYPVVFSSRPSHDVAINVLIYISLGLGLNIVIGLAGMLDLGYIAFYGVGAYSYALLNINFGLSFWAALPAAALLLQLQDVLSGIQHSE